MHSKVNRLSTFKGGLNPTGPSFFGVPGSGAGGGRKVPAAHNSKTIRGFEMKFGRVVENHKLINLVQFNW